jgi:hypothetical protein
MQTSLVTPVPLDLHCHDQSGQAHQLGFRLLSDAHIRAFGHAFAAPCPKYGWESFSQWEAYLDALPRGARIEPYTRELRVFDGVHAVHGHLTIARNSRSARTARAQGWITASKDSPLYDFVAAHLGEKLHCRFVPSRDQDALLLPGVAWTIRAAA